MKRKIDQLLNGIFEYETPKLILSEERIDASVRKGESVRGSFTIENTAEKKAKGFLYTESPRVGFEPTAFSAVSERILYEIDTKGLQEGEVLEGAFTIASSFGEKHLPYRITIRPSEVCTLAGPFENLEEFRKEAQADFQKAYVFFVSADFKRLLQKVRPDLLLLYEGMMTQSLNYQSLEEFLIAAGLKENVKVRADRESVSYGVLTQTIQEKIILTKNSWGFLRLHVSVDAPFLKVEREIVTTEEFIGSTYTLNYLIQRAKLHPGRNFGRITIEGSGQKFVFEVVAHGGLSRRGNLNLKAQHRRTAEIYRLYLDYRLNRIEKKEWVQRSQEALGEYRKAGGNHGFMDLLEVQLLFGAGKEEEACLLLEKLEQHKQKMQTPEIRGYFLYLTTFYNQDKKYLDYAAEKLEELSLRNPENWKLLWFLMQLRETFRRHPGQKLDAIREQFIRGSASRLLYLEAAFVLQSSPLLLKKLESFELRVLDLMVKEDLLNGELVMQLVELSGRYREYSKELFILLTKVYEKYPSRSLVRAINGLLLKGRKKGAVYFPWYEKGVEEDIRMTGLYEYYIESMEAPVEKPLPQIIRMYFSYNNTLDYRKKAFVYANVIRNKETDQKSYQSYRPAMEKFMIDQLMASHINHDLAFLYQTFVTKAILNKRLAEKLSKLLFTHEVVLEKEFSGSVVVLHGELEQEQKVTVRNRKAKVQLYTDDYQIFLEDEEGNRSISSISFTVQPFLQVPEFWEYCKELSPDAPGMLLYFVNRARRDGGIQKETVRSFIGLLSLEGIREGYKKEIRQEILDYYANNPKEESRYDDLRELDLAPFVETDKYKLIDLMVSEGMSKEAFSLLSVYGPENVNLHSLVSLCHRMILSWEYEEDEMLLALCYYCFAHEKYDEIVLTYLLRYYDGPVEQMERLWKRGDEFQADTFLLEEKILAMILFTQTGAKGSEAIFDSYRRGLGRKRILRAYVIYMSYHYLVKEEEAGEPVFRYIERGFAKGKIEEDVCLLALLKYYSGLPELTAEQRENSERLLTVYTNRGIHLACFKNFPEELQRAFQLYDKTFVEYRANPKALVRIRYRIDSPERAEGTVHAEPMNHVFEGIFIKEFTLFYGETLTCRVEEEWNGEQKFSEETEWRCKETDPFKSTQFDLLNQLSEAVKEKNLEDAEFAVLQFREQEQLSERIFTLQ